MVFIKLLVMEEIKFYPQYFNTIGFQHSLIWKNYNILFLANVQMENYIRDRLIYYWATVELILCLCLQQKWSKTHFAKPSHFTHQKQLWLTLWGCRNYKCMLTVAKCICTAYTFCNIWQWMKLFSIRWDVFQQYIPWKLKILAPKFSDMQHHWTHTL